MKLQDCPHCGCRNRSKRRTCWRCGETLYPSQDVSVGVSEIEIDYVVPFMTRWRTALRKNLTRK